MSQLGETNEISGSVLLTWHEKASRVLGGCEDESKAGNVTDFDDDDGSRVYSLLKWLVWVLLFES